MITTLLGHNCSGVSTALPAAHRRNCVLERERAAFIGDRDARQRCSGSPRRGTAVGTPSDCPLLIPPPRTLLGRIGVAAQIRRPLLDRERLNPGAADD